MSASSRGRVARASDGTPLRYVVGAAPGAQQKTPIDPSVVGDAYARLPKAKGRIYLGPVRSAVGPQGALVLRFRLAGIPARWEHVAGGVSIELELEPVDAIDGGLVEQAPRRARGL